MAKSAIHFKAYNTTIRVHKWTEKNEAPLQGKGRGSESCFSVDDAAAVRTVKVSGFEKMTTKEIKQNRGVLVDRLESKKHQGGRVEKIEVMQPRRATAKPFAIATFKSATGKFPIANVNCYLSAAARDSFLFKMRVILWRTTKQKRSSSLGACILSSSSTRRRPNRQSRLPMSSTL